MRVLPWLPDDAIAFLNTLFKWWPLLLGRPLKVLEFGCGNSTLYFASKGCSVTSVESVDEYSSAVSAALAHADLTYGPFVGEVSFVSAANINEVPTRLWSMDFDVVLIDGPNGVSRHELLEAFSRSDLMENAMLVVDNVEYMANWGSLDIHAAYPERIRSFRNFYRNLAERGLFFESRWGRSGGAVPDATGWESDTRVIAAITWGRNHPVFGKALLTASGLPIVSPEGWDDGDVDSVRSRSEVVLSGDLFTGRYHQTFHIDLSRE